MPDFVDPYIDPDTGLLRNLMGARTQEQFDRSEAALTRSRNNELRLQPVNFTGDFRQLSEIHRRLFQDVFDWAGERRTVDISKPGGDHFMPQAALVTGAANAFQMLADDALLTGLDAQGFVDKLAKHYDQVNYLHPFREGNGRTQRIFWSQVALRAGHPLNWRAVSAQENNHASRAAMEDSDFGPLKALLTAAVTVSSPTGRRAPISQGPTDQSRRPEGPGGGQFDGKPQSPPEISL